MQQPMHDLAWPQQPASSARVVQWQRLVQHVSWTVFACQLFDLFTTPSLDQHFQPHLTYCCGQYLAYLLEFYCLEGYVPLLNCWYPISWSCGFHTPHLPTTLNLAGPEGYELQDRCMWSQWMAGFSVVMMTASSMQQREWCWIWHAEYISDKVRFLYTCPACVLNWYVPQLLTSHSTLIHAPLMSFPIISDTFGYAVPPVGTTFTSSYGYSYSYTKLSVWTMEVLFTIPSTSVRVTQVTWQGDWSWDKYYPTVVSCPPMPYYHYSNSNSWLHTNILPGLSSRVWPRQMQHSMYCLYFCLGHDLHWDHSWYSHLCIFRHHGWVWIVSPRVLCMVCSPLSKFILFRSTAYIPASSCSFRQCSHHQMLWCFCQASGVG